MSTPAQGADGAGTKTEERRQMAEGCCSAVSPCSHQQRDPYSLCDICLKANGFAERIALATPRSDSAERTAGEEPDISELGRVVWHSSDEDSGPDVGVTIGFGSGRSLWFGEISKKMYEEAGVEAAELGDDFGAWIILYDDNKPRGEQATVIGKAIPYVGTGVCDAISASLRASATPAPSSPGVPDSVRALSEAATKGEWVEAGGTDFRAVGLGVPGRPIGMTSPAGYGNGLTDRAFIVAAVNWVRTLLSAHPAGQSTGQVAGEVYQPKIETCEKCGAQGVAFICDQPGCPVNGGAAHPGQRYSNPAPDSPLTGPVGMEEARLIGPKMTPEQEERIAHNLCGEFGPDAVMANATFVKAFYAELYAAARPAAPEAQGAWSLEPEGKPVQSFRNRAGETDTDDAIAFELEAAGIEVLRLEILRKHSGEVKTAVRGELHGWSFKRAWRYWVAEGPGIELAAADVLYAAHPETVRVNGHCGCPSPREQNNGLAIGSYHVDSPAGLKGLADTIKAIVAQSAPPSSGQGGR